MIDAVSDALPLRPESTVERHALVLGAVPLKESDRLFTFLTLEHGKISAVAKGAAKSQRRFPAGVLEVTHHIKAQLYVPRENGGADTPLWRLERADLRGTFPHFRQTYNGLEAMLFVVRMIQDLIPEGHVDAALFRALGRFLRDSESVNFDRDAGWVRVAFWSWLAHHLGFGDLSDGLETRMLAADLRWPETWHHYLAREEPDFKGLFYNLGEHPLAPLELSDEILVYRRWVDISGINWDHFEQWVASKRTH